jgi:elongation factor 4
VIAVSGKSGLNCEDVLKAVVERIPCPPSERHAPLQCLLFDTWFDQFRGVVCLVRVVSGSLKFGDRVMMKSTGKWYEVQIQGAMHPEPVVSSALHAGQVGFVLMNMKNPIDARVGDTLVDNEETEALPGFVAPNPMVFSGIYPMDSSEYEALEKAMDKLTLNDASVSVQKETSNALGMGFRCGFLGLLHMDVFRQRMEQEHEADIIVTNPTVPYIARMLETGTDVIVSNPSNFPDASLVEYFEEPIILASVITPVEYMGPIMELCKERRGEQVDIEYLDSNQVLFKYILPLGEIVLDFYDGLKGQSKGYASLDYETAGYRKAEVVRVNFVLNGAPVDALSTICHR